MSSPVHLPLDRVIKAIERELGMRRRVYPRRCAENKMTVAQAAEETLNMQAAKDTLTVAVELLHAAHTAVESVADEPLERRIRAFLDDVHPPKQQPELF